MAIRSEDLYLSIPNASPLFSKLAISTQFKVSLDLVRRSQVGDNVGLLEHLLIVDYLINQGHLVKHMIFFVHQHLCQVLTLISQRRWEVVKE